MATPFLRHTLASATAIALGTLAGGAHAQTFTQVCSDVPNVRIEWNKTPFFGGFAYSVKSLRAENGSTSSAGFTLHHRPAAGWPNNHFEPDTVVTGASILNYSIWDALIPVVPLPFGDGTPYTVTSLTCPNGECVVSPITGCAPTYDRDRTGPKVAVVGDSLTTLNELCWARPPAEGCAVEVSTLLRNAGNRVWLTAGPGQGFFSWLDVTRERATTRPNKFVLAFGSNDALRQARATTAAARDAERNRTFAAVAASLNAIRAANPAACVVFTTASGKPVSPAQYPTEVGLVNGLLKTLAANNTNVQIADFAAAAASACPSDWLTNPNRTCDLFSPDQIHLTRKGNEIRSPLVAAAASRCQ